ncbi:MAG: carboxypeptidase regulatory-like domain-containing protein [Candidatus Yonathbacteria bacterium]|nr:carboxypeptidase regulatory-like domain-containing protein [Candidatus Yonathbacteria bacterium]NTW47561.1 carboxypeptidase regulatory-like domain-containing protein [Candidatus Yonathbacteria bacterium]
MSIFFLQQHIYVNRVASHRRGFSLIDIVVGTALFLLVFVSIAGVFRLSVALVAESKARIGALSLAQETVEFVRSMSYGDVGVVGGIPAGELPQSETITMNGVSYTRRILVLYDDNPADGVGDDDENGITTDNKRFSVSVSWESRGMSRSVRLVSTIVPQGIETSAGGGTLIVNVADASLYPLADVTVHIENASVSPSVSMDVFTNSQGRVMVDGAPSAGEYEIVVSKDGYSTVRTYDVSEELSAPSPGHASILEGQSTVVSFQTDRVSSLNIYTRKPLEPWSLEDMLEDSNLLAATTGVTVSGGHATLASNGMGGHVLTGTVLSNTIAPSYLSSWESFDWDALEPVGTSIVWHVYEENGGNPVLLSEEVLPGNTEGFTSGPINISSVSASLYPKLRIGAEFSTNNEVYTPTLYDWSLSTIVGPVPLGDVPFTIVGRKTKGTDDGIPVSIIERNEITNSAGFFSVGDLLWDMYDIVTGGAYDIADSCVPDPYNLAPDEHPDVSLIVVPHTAHSLRISVFGNGDVPLEGASVRVNGVGYDETIVSSSCGQVFFVLPGSGTYTYTISATGYEVLSETVSVSGTVTLSKSLDH